MPAVQTASHLSDELLNTVRQLNTSDLMILRDEVALLYAQRRAPHLSHDETRLFQIINNGLPQDKLRRYRELQAELDNETITEGEHAELTDLIDQMELLNAERVGAMVELAQIRNTTLEAVAESLGLGKKHAVRKAIIS